METRVAVISIIVENPEATEQLNQYLHESGKYIIGRMGIPYRQKGIHIISIAIDAPQDVISALSGKIGRLKGVSAKTAYSNVITKPEELQFMAKAVSENLRQFPIWRSRWLKKDYQLCRLAVTQRQILRLPCAMENLCRQYWISIMRKKAM